MADESALRVLIVDDERAARQRLQDLLGTAEGVQRTERASNGNEAIEAIRTRNFDLVFLDVQMPGCTGIEVIEEVGPEHMPAVVFVTAYDQYALKAFEVAALDYLLKPFDDERFERALDRAREMIATQALGDLRSRLATLTEASVESPQAASSTHYVERIAVDMRGQKRIVPVERIDFITASGSYAELHVGGDTYVIREQMQTLEERLDPADFCRIHRSAIVRLDRVEVLLHREGGHYAVRLHDGKTLKVSRSRYEALRQQLGLDVL